jgi:hypothetical protein
MEGIYCRSVGEAEVEVIEGSLAETLINVIIKKI